MKIQEAKTKRGSRLLVSLPWPPSVNHYWLRSLRGSYLSREGREFREAVIASVASQGLPRLRGRLQCRLQLYPPDHRRRDIDNVAKSLLDALQHAGYYDDDSQIDRLTIVRREVDREEPRVVVFLQEME